MLGSGPSYQTQYRSRGCQIVLQGRTLFARMGHAMHCHRPSPSRRKKTGGDQTCHQVHFQHGIFNNFCSTIGQFNKNLFNNRQFHQQHYSTIGLFNNFKFNIRQLNNSVMVNSTTKIFYRSRRVGVAESRG